MWTPRPPEPPPVGWWTELSLQRWVAGVAADRRQSADQAKRLRRLRRQAERIEELVVLAESTSEARRHLRRKFGPNVEGLPEYRR